MNSPWIAALRSVTLNVPDLARAEDFYTRIWRLEVAARSDDAVYLHGNGTDHHLLALHAAPTDTGPQIRHVTLRARSAEALAQIAAATRQAGGSLHGTGTPDDRHQDKDNNSDPAGGQSLTLRDPDGRLIQVVFGDSLRDAAPPAAAIARDQPLRLAHVVLNSHDVPATQRWFEQALGFTLADRTRIMAFMNCNRDHHSIALGDADNDALNHIAFLMPDIDAVMRGGGRMKDAGHAIEWGPGRHGPGDNAFNYFIDPFGVVIEYTAEVEQIDDGYRVGGPTDWTWPAGRVDHWGISAPPSVRLKAAQRAVFFTPSHASD